jgi:hypothetical protein
VVAGSIQYAMHPDVTAGCAPEKGVALVSDADAANEAPQPAVQRRPLWREPFPDAAPVPKDTAMVFTDVEQTALHELPDGELSPERLARDGAMSTSIGSYVDEERTAVAVYLTQHDVDQIQLGLPVDLEAADHRGKTLSVHVMRERRRQPRPRRTNP